MSTNTAEPTSPPKADVPHEVVVTCPATGQVVGSVPVATSVEVETVAARLRAAQPAWQQMGVEGRARWLGKWRDWMLDHTDELLTLLQLETGKSWGDANIEIAGVQIINYWIDNAADFLADESVRPYGAANAAKKLTITYEPYPLVGVITPWNGPLSVPLERHPRGVDGGLRRAVQQPSEVTPLVWRMAVDGWKEIGAPDVLDAVFGFGETGAALVDLVDYVMFTGSVNTGRRIAVAAAQRLIPCSLELGGKDAMIVCADADIDRAADGAVFGAFAYTGQVWHIGGTRLRRGTGVRRVRQQGGGQNRATAPRHGRQARLLLRGRVDDHRANRLAIVTDHVDDAVRKGAKVLVGGKSGDPAGLFYEPTVLVDVDHDMTCMREETFGPTLPVMKVRDAAEAIEKANDSRLGLSGSVWTRDRNKATALARKMNTGMVNINNVIAGAFQFPLPFAGWNESGVGSRSGGASGIRKYCRTKSIVAEQGCDEERAALVSATAPRRASSWEPWSG